MGHLKPPQSPPLEPIHDGFDDEGDGSLSTLCPRGQRHVDPAAAGLHYAVRLKRIDTVGGIRYVEDVGGFVHAGCSVPFGWRSKPKTPTQPRPQT